MSGKDATARIWDESDEELVSFVDSEWDEVEEVDNNVYAVMSGDHFLSSHDLYIWSTSDVL